MSIKIDSQLCLGCGSCRKVCPGDLIQFDQERKAWVRYPEDCWGCAACVKECEIGAIRYFLAPDIGGTGTYFYTRRGKGYLHWHFAKGEQEIRVITINTQESNEY